jgi:hypothetical protein
MSTGRRWLATALAAYGVLLAVALLAPSSTTQSEMASWVVRLGTSVGFSPETATQARAEFLCNVAILAPVTALGSLLWPAVGWRAWTAYAFVASCGVESVQGLLLPGRTLATDDVVANTLGALGGALVVLVWWRLSATGERRQELHGRAGLDQD